MPQPARWQKRRWLLLNVSFGPHPQSTPFSRRCLACFSRCNFSHAAFASSKRLRTRSSLTFAMSLPPSQSCGPVRVVYHSTFPPIRQAGKPSHPQNCSPDPGPRFAVRNTIVRPHCGHRRGADPSLRKGIGLPTGKTSAARRGPFAPVVCAAPKAAFRRRSGSRTQRDHARSSIVSPVSASRKGFRIKSDELYRSPIWHSVTAMLLPGVRPEVAFVE